MPAAYALEINAIARDTAEGHELHAEWAAPAGVLSEAELTELSGLWVEALQGLPRSATVAGNAGPPPSDLPLADLTQEEIELLEATDPGLADVLPLTSLQEGFLFHSLQEASADGDTYNTQVAFDFEGPVDAAALRAAGQAFLDRHPNLRAGFRHEGLTAPVQVLHARVVLALQEAD